MTSRAAGRLLLGGALVVVALNMRPVFSSIAAVLPEVMRDTGASALAAGLVTTIPVVCLGLFGPLAPVLAGRLGAERALLLVLAVLAGGTALRGLATVPTLLAGAAIAGAAIAVGNVLLPSMIKRDFPDRSALMTAFYSMAMCGGGALGAGLTVPMAQRAGGWPAALGLWAVPALLAGLLWAPYCFRRPDLAGLRAAAPGGLWRNPLAWRITLFMGLQSALAYCVFGWMAPLLRSRGFGPESAGFLTSASIMAQVAASFVTPWLATRGRDQRATCYGLLALAVTGLVGAVFAPPGLVPAAVVIQGLGQGGLFGCAMLIIILRSPDPHVAAHLSGMAQGVGYVIAAGGPLLLGLLREASGSFAPAAFLFVAIGAGAAWAASWAGRDVLVAPRREDGRAAA